MDQLIIFPTRGENTLDMTIANRPGLMSDIGSPAKFSDHDTISCSLQSARPTQRKPCRKIYQYTKGDYDAIRADIASYMKNIPNQTWLPLLLMRIGNDSQKPCNNQLKKLFHQNLSAAEINFLS